MPGLCDVEAPPLRDLAKGARIRCHHSESELLQAQTGAGKSPSTERQYAHLS